MNFILHQKEIQNLLYTKGKKPYSGNYIYSRDEKDGVYKMGMSEAGLFRRVKQAGSCYPFKTEFWLHYLIISLDGTKSKVKGKKSTTRKIENYLHAQSKDMSTVEIQKEDVEQGQRPREYRVISNKTNLYKLLKDTLNTHRDKWDWLVVFTVNGWHIIPNNRLAESGKPIKSITMLKPKSKIYSKQPQIDSMPINSTKLIIPKNVKVGDIIESDNWATFTVVEVISKRHVSGKFKGDKKVYDIKV